MDVLKKSLISLVAALALMGCEANGGFPGGAGGGGGGGGSDAGDADGDGVPDNIDLCPDTPEGETANAIGCSESQFGDPLPTGLVCTSYGSGTANALEASGNLCGLGTVLDPVLGQVLGTSTCTVTDPENAGDGDASSFASVSATAALLDPNQIGGTASPLDGNTGIALTGIGTRPAGSIASWEVEYPTSTVDLGILNGVFVITLLDGTVVDTFDATEMLQLGLGGTGVVGVGEGHVVLGGIASGPYNELRVLATASLLGADVGMDSSEASIFVYDSCTAAAVPDEG